MKMTHGTALLAALATAAAVQAEPAPLTEADRQALIEQLDSLRGEASQQAKTRLERAAADLSAAVASDGAATDLYLKCVEKVDFEERERRASDFRDWKRRHKDRLDDPGHALALRHQIRWTVLTLKAATKPDETASLVPEALNALDAIYRTPAELRGHVSILGQSVGSTVFARAYGLTGYAVEGWPMAPLQNGGRVRVDGPFEQLVFPKLRAKGDIAGLRDAWQRRLRFEEIALGFWSADSTPEGESEARKTFVADERPRLAWDMEEDLFRAGDQQRAALALLKHLRDHISHSQAREWEARFRELVDPAEPPSPATTGPGT